MSASDPLPTRSEDAIRRVAQACDYCTRAIVWTDARNGRMPVDAAPDADGNVLVQIGPLGLTSTVVGTKQQRAAFQTQGWHLRVAHKLTCPYADKWSRPSDKAQQREHLARVGRPPARRR